MNNILPNYKEDVVFYKSFNTNNFIEVIRQVTYDKYSNNEYNHYMVKFISYNTHIFTIHLSYNLYSMFYEPYPIVNITYELTSNEKNYTTTTIKYLYKSMQYIANYLDDIFNDKYIVNDIVGRSIELVYNRIIKSGVKSMLRLKAFTLAHLFKNIPQQLKCIDNDYYMEVYQHDYNYYCIDVGCRGDID